MLRFEHVSFSYGSKEILKDISFEVEDNKFIVFIGPSGCGKTTTLKMINRLIKPNSGHIYINDQDVANIDPNDLRRHIGYVIQQIGLFPNMTVEENICVVPKLLKQPKETYPGLVKELLEMVNMPYEEYAHKYPSEMSGGQQQRIGILRALAGSPPMILMDEPFSALDPMTRRTLQVEIKKLQQKLNKTVIFVTHDMEEALELADIIVFLDKGYVAQAASPEEMLANPASEEIRNFLGKHLIPPEDLKVSDFMRTGIISVEQNKGINECIRRMQRSNVDTLLVVDNKKKYQGTVSIEDIRLTGKVVDNIGTLVRCTTPTVRANDNAKECFEKLIESKRPYLVVLNDDDTIAGIITKTSMASAMAEHLWG